MSARIKADIPAEEQSKEQSGKAKDKKYVETPLMKQY